MADKIREALFSSLASLGAEPDTVLDLYAGTGSIGIEALSRGANWADFVDHQKAACATIKDNLAHTRLSDSAEVHCMPVEQIYRRLQGPYDLVIVDPPYADPDIEAHLERLSRSALVQSGTLVVLGHWPRLQLPEQVGTLSLVKRRCHGDSCFSIFEVDSTDPASDGICEAPET